jgi:hypothetical protein
MKFNTISCVTNSIKQYQWTFLAAQPILYWLFDCKSEQFVFVGIGLYNEWIAYTFQKNNNEGRLDEIVGIP